MLKVNNQLDTNTNKALYQINIDKVLSQNELNRTNGNYLILLDKSVSMKKGKKMSFALATIKYMIETLDENDTFSLIAFNNETDDITDRLFNNSRFVTMTLENKKIFINELNNIHPENYTNISDPLFKAINNSQECFNENLTHIMLFTDGLPNEGFTEKEIIDLMTKKDIKSHICLHTFGFGNDCCTFLLSSLPLCLKGGGKYYHMSNIRDIPEKFGECLEMTKNLVSRDLKLYVRTNKCKIKKICANFLREGDRDYIVLFLGHIFKSETKSVIFKLFFNDDWHDKKLEYILTYTDNNSKKYQIKREISIDSDATNLNLDKQYNAWKVGNLLRWEAPTLEILKQIKKIKNSKSSVLCNYLINILETCHETQRFDESYNAFFGETSKEYMKNTIDNAINTTEKYSLEF